MKKVGFTIILAIFLFALPQVVSTSPGSEGTYVFELKWGSSGTGDGLFNMPRSVAVDSEGNVYVADTSNNRIQKFDSFGNFIMKWGSYGDGDGQFRYPWGVCVDSDSNVYVADTTNQRIQKFDSDGGLLGWIGLDNDGNTGWHPPGTGKYGIVGLGDGQFYNPYDVAVDSAGYIYVVDTYSHRIQKFDSDGGFLGWIGLDDDDNTGWHDPGTETIGVSGSGDGQFYWPRGVAVDSEGNVYVADASNHRIQKFDSFGVFLGWWGFDNVYFTGWHNPGTGTVGVSGTGDGQFKYPWGVGVDLDDNIYVADTQNQRFQKFDSSGVLLGWWGYDNNYFTGWHPPGTGAYGISWFEDGQFWLPYDVAVDLDDNVFVVDTYNRRIQKFDLVPPLGVISPNGGEILDANTSYEITWEPGIGNVYVKIEYSVDNGANWEEIVLSTENDRSYNWDVPCNLSDICLVRITGLDDGALDESDSVFSIESGTPPVITLEGLPVMVLECGIDTYEEPGATAEDGCGNEVQVDIGGDTVDTTICGEYIVTYNATDASGLAAAEETRKVTVQDTTPPDTDVDNLQDIEGECSIEISLIPTATDICSGTITGEPSAPLVDTGHGTYMCTVLGTHPITWTYTDGSGNFATQTQTITVVDTIPPDPDADDLEEVKGECMVEISPVPTATDDCTGSVIKGVPSAPLVKTDQGTYICTEQGTYTVTWTYTDTSGNSSTQIQSVIVKDETAPVLDSASLDTLEGECSVEITTIPTATDNCCGSIKGVPSGPVVETEQGTYICTEQGTHTITWTYTDESGNSATQEQIIKVEDVTPPTIMLSDPTCVDINRWEKVNILTVSASDNCSSEVEVVIDKVEVFNKRGHRVWGDGIYRIVRNEIKRGHRVRGRKILIVVENDIYVFPNGKDWSVCITATAIDEKGNTKTEELCKPLLQCNRWSKHMARLISLLLSLLMKHCHCW